jgi:DNA repair exonuclease SbcCD ATPase subunit
MEKNECNDIEILYLYLKNFAPIYTGMKKTEVEIFFDKKQNGITLIVGPNGTGKTFLISHMQPFAYTGNVDVRSNINTIIDGKNAKKVIHIRKGNHIFKIEHFYKNSKTGVIIKSFIKKNDEELNKNGNVTSFLEIVKEELGIEQDHLKMMRLGSNTINITKMKSSERKVYFSTLLPDVDEYLAKYKKVNNDLRILNSLIKSVSDKIDKLHVIDINIIDKDINDDIVNIERIKSALSIKQQKLGELENIIKTMLPEKFQSFGTNASLYEQDISKLQTRKKNIESNMSEIFKSINIDIYENTLIKRHIELDKNKSVADDHIQMLLSQKSQLANKLQNLNIELDKLTSGSKYKNLKELYDVLNKSINDIPDTNKKDPGYTKDLVNHLDDIIHDLNNTLSEIYGYSQKSILAVIDIISKGENVESNVNRLLEEINNTVSMYTMKQTLNTKDNVFVLFTPIECNINKCPYKNIVDDILFKDCDDDINVDKLKAQQEILYEMLYVNSHIQYIIKTFNSNMQLFNKCNLVTDKNYIMDIIKKNRYIEESITYPLHNSTESYNEYLSLVSRLDETVQKLNKLNSSAVIIERIENDIEKIKMEIKNIDEQIQKEISQLNDITKELSDMKKDFHRLDKYKALNNDLIITSDNITKMRSMENNIFEMGEINSHIKKLETQLIALDNSLMTKRLIKSSYNELIKEKDILDKKYSKLQYVKDALSPNKGIPLIYMQLFTQDTKNKINNILNYVYHGELEVDDFDITPTDFNIPYIKDGIRIPDISYASDGERAFLTLGLSFALVNGILLLDELDGPLDSSNRALFLNTLEQGMKIFNMKQAFLITHNDMFDCYPVDVIMTKAVDVQNNSNVIARLYE